LDELLVKQEITPTRSQAKLLINEGHILCNNKIITKAGTMVPENSRIKNNNKNQYVSRGAYKLIQALDEFHFDIKNKIAADIGASTGGFSEVLLQREIKKVYAIDVGHDQLSPHIKNNKKIINMEGINVHHKFNLPEQVDIMVIDLSFISLRKVIPNLKEHLNKNSKIIALIKPQFEAGPEIVNKQGVIKNPKVREKILKKLLNWIKTQDLRVINYITSPIIGKKGNVEYLVYLKTVL